MLQKIIDTLQAEYGIDERRILVMMTAGANELDMMSHQTGWDKVDTSMHDASEYLYNETRSMIQNFIEESKDDRI